MISQRLDFCNLRWIAKSILSKGKFVLLPLFDGLEASDNAKLFLEIFSKISGFDEWGISLPAFPSKNNS